MPDRGREWWALTALVAILGITAAWWALALWPLPSDVPDWVVRTRLACFGRTESGLPDGGGWLLLVGQPAGMLTFLLVVWPGPVVTAIGRLAARASGRMTLSFGATVLLVGGSLAAIRVSTAAAAPRDSALAGSTMQVLDRAAPTDRLVNQYGDTVSIAALSGAPVIVTFAFANCETVCPLVVHDALAARRALGGSTTVLVVTLDPWRDTPSRLPAIAQTWGLGDHEYVLSGTVDAVNAALDAWGVARQRDERTGDVVHPRLTFVVESGRVVAGGTGQTRDLVSVVGR